MIFHPNNEGLAKNTYFDGFYITGGGPGQSLNGIATYLRPGMHLRKCKIFGNTPKNGTVNPDGKDSHTLLPQQTIYIFASNDKNTCEI